MTVEVLRTNIERAKKLAYDLNIFIQRLDLATDKKEKKLLEQTIISTKNQISIINNSIPFLLNEVYVSDDFHRGKGKDEVIGITHETSDGGVDIAIQKSDKRKYLQELRISETSLKSLVKKKKKSGDLQEFVYKKPSSYISLSNKFFLNTSNDLVEKGYFHDLEDALKRGNFVFLLNSYVSMILFTTFISAFVGVFLAILFFFVSFDLANFSVYFVDFAETTILSRLLSVVWIIFVVPIATFLILLYYPSSERSAIESKINYELPFVTIQMAAVAGADIEPSNIFRIIAMSKEYPNIRMEAKKLMNQINLYGFDLVTALKNVADASSSRKWAELLNGMSTTIRSGGDLAKYLNKRAETLLFEYRLEREKATRAAETFMDIYISVVVAAPMLMLLLLVMMSLSGIGFPLSIPAITIIIVSVVAVINVVFLMFLNSSQKKL